MMAHRHVLTAGLVLTLAWPLAAQQDSEEAERLTAAITALEEIMAAGDAAIPESILGDAEAIAVVPGTIKAGFFLGGMRGKGIISVRDGSGSWSAPAFLTLTGGSIGLQIGGQSTDLVLVINNEKGVETLIRNQFKLGADASVAAGPIGRDAQAATDAQMRAQILSYSRARGVFAGVTINGSTIRQDRDANRRFYGKALDTRQILFERISGTPDPVPAWRALLAKYAG
ncbi:MAG: lipid-binding SYLF domain-containing protein [Acidimicrobiia bacterium]|nr:lipid-binding SYLF domain-containing protein [Acidimicrobiia bacterium]